MTPVLPENCDTTNLTYVDYFPSWSPIGDKIVFFHHDSFLNNCGIYTIDTSSLNMHISRSDCNARNPAWSHDGNWIVFESDNLLYKMNPGGGNLTPVTTTFSSYYPSWRYDDQWIVFDSHDSLPYYSIWKIRPDGTGKKFIGEVNSGGRMPDWSPDGKYICYQKPVSSTQKQIFVMDTLGNPGRRVTNNNRNDFYPKYSPDGTKILYQSESSTGCINIWVINTDGTNDTRLTNFQSDHPSWSPDGEMIVYVNTEKDNGYLSIMKKDGTGIRHLTYH